MIDETVGNAVMDLVSDPAGEFYTLFYFHPEEPNVFFNAPVAEVMLPIVQDQCPSYEISAPSPNDLHWNKLAPGWRIVDGEKLYSAAWLSDG